MVAGGAGVRVAAAADGVAVTSGRATGVIAGLARGVGLLGGEVPGSSRGFGGVGIVRGVAPSSRGSGGVPEGVLAACTGCCCSAKLI